MEKKELSNVPQEEQLTNEEILTLQKEANEMSPEDLKATGMYVQASLEEALAPNPNIKETRQQRRARERAYRKLQEQWGKIQSNKKLRDNLSEQQQQKIYSTFLSKMKAMNKEFEELKEKQDTETNNNEEKSE